MGLLYLYLGSLVLCLVAAKLFASPPLAVVGLIPILNTGIVVASIVSLLYYGFLLLCDKLGIQKLFDKYLSLFE